MHARSGRRAREAVSGVIGRRIRRRGLLCAAVRASASLFALAAARPWRAALAAPTGPLVFAAASTKDALEAIDRLWRAQGHARVRFSFAASSALARQLEQGAPADLFISADTQWMDYAKAKHLVREDTVRPLLGNRLALVAPADAPPAGLALRPGVDIAGALGGGRLALADVQSVPAGRYARAALVSLGAWQSVASRLAMTENVRVALALVARGEAPMGIVYESDARAESRVRVIALFPEQTHPPIRYPVAIAAASTHAQARAFYDHLRSAPAGASFREHGFSPLG